MCGICGFIGPDRGSIDRAGARAMNATLTHRGPDGHGELEVAAADPRRPLRGWLGHRRLKIVDLTAAAHQPMTSADGAIALTYNGEVYNFRALRRELESRGHSFRSSGDTEVVLRAYEEWGEDAISRLDGMFALAIWDGRRGRLLLARDRTGKKPLFYVHEDGILTFGSEIKALRAAPWVSLRPDLAKVPEFLTYGYVPHPETFYAGVLQVPPACTVTYDAAGLHPPREYWDPLPPRLGGRPGAGERDTIARLLADATERRLVSDVPLGAFLSGGIDSSLVVGLMARATSEPVRTFSIGFPDEPSYDERSYAKQVAEHFHTRHTEFAVRADAVALLDRLLWHHDQPFADSSAIPTYMVSQLAREHVTVVLNGDGGDEVFGGYDRFVAARVSSLIPRRGAHAARTAARVLPVNHGYYSLRRRAERFFELAERPVRDRYQSWIAVFNADGLASVLAGGRVGGERLTASMERHYARAHALPELDRILYANFKTYLPDDLAVKMDRMSMAHSVETRSPFLDTALVEYLAAIPAAHKVGLRRVKPLLRAALRPLLPDAIWDRRKHGFGVPMGRWMREGLGELVRDEVLAPDARVNAVLRPEALRAMWEEHRRGEREHGPRLWTLLTLERWLRSAEERPAPGPPLAAALSA